MPSYVLPPPVPAPTPPGWYPDPWGVAQYRWWDGRAWSVNIAHGHGDIQAPSPAVGGATGPRLPAWLSPPVLVAGLLWIPALALTVIEAPVALLLALVPLVFIVPVLSWIDRLEPEPWTSRLHAFLWGATVATVVSGLVNAIVLVNVSETAAAVVSAPLIEETMKGLGILWAVRRAEVDGPVDGIVYGGWVGAGFALIENVEYFWLASEDGVLAETFVVRALLTPFAHPLFAAWTGLAIGLAVVRRTPLPASALWGWLIAVGLHAAWNGSIIAAVDRDDARLLAVAAVGFVGIFIVTVVMVLLVRRAERRAYLVSMPYMAQRYRVPASQVGMFSTWGEMLAHRRALPRGQRRSFDDTHAALARLAALHAQPGPTDPVAEQRLEAQLKAARDTMMSPSP